MFKSEGSDPASKQGGQAETNAPKLTRAGSTVEQYAENMRRSGIASMEGLKTKRVSSSLLTAEEQAELGIEYPDGAPEDERDEIEQQALNLYYSDQERSRGRISEAINYRYRRWKFHLNLSRRVHKEQAKSGVGHRFPRVRRWVRTQTFEICLSSLIIGNCFFIGWQAEQFDPDDTTKVVTLVFEHFFTLGFLVELVLRIFCYNWTFFFDSENYLDIFLVVLSVLTTWILGPFNVKADFLRKATLLRVLRLTRLARQVKTRPEFKEMWALIRGLGDSMQTLFWTYVMIGCVLYFFAIMACSLLAKQGAFEEPESVNQITQENFGDVIVSMFTLFQVMTLDSWTGLMRPLMDVHGWVVIFFIVFISVAEFMLMNLVTAVIVKTAFERAKEDKADLAAELEAQKEKDMQDLQLFFEDMDADKSGSLSREELFLAYRTNNKIRNKFRTLDIGRKDLDTLFQALDDGDGELDLEEFLSGMRKLKGEAKAKDMLRLYREVKCLELSIKEISELSEIGKQKITNVKMKLGATFRELDATRRTLRRMKEAAKLASKAQPFL